eukprot:TRINITY_DN3623_c0_g1_i1.p1 TRINITY_DN3623_c0_g1~~TRINITY_DN3623_c0_g1_i1.p1  ORF type:complete len:577 (-),score=103.05 TRINITY_DN3623_c0_g1_i1:97-1827(-)
MPSCITLHGGQFRISATSYPRERPEEALLLSLSSPSRAPPPLPVAKSGGSGSAAERGGYGGGAGVGGFGAAGANGAVGAGSASAGAEYGLRLGRRPDMAETPSAPPPAAVRFVSAGVVSPRLQAKVQAGLQYGGSHSTAVRDGSVSPMKPARELSLTRTGTSIGTSMATEFGRKPSLQTLPDAGAPPALRLRRCEEPGSRRAAPERSPTRSVYAPRLYYRPIAAVPVNAGTSPWVSRVPHDLQRNGSGASSSGSGCASAGACSSMARVAAPLLSRAVTPTAYSAPPAAGMSGPCAGGSAAVAVHRESNKGPAQTPAQPRVRPVVQSPLFSPRVSIAAPTSAASPPPPAAPPFLGAGAEAGAGGSSSVATAPVPFGSPVLNSRQVLAGLGSSGGGAGYPRSQTAMGDVRPFPVHVASPAPRAAPQPVQHFQGGGTVRVRMQPFPLAPPLPTQQQLRASSMSPAFERPAEASREQEPRPRKPPVMDVDSADASVEDKLRQWLATIPTAPTGAVVDTSEPGRNSNAQRPWDDAQIVKIVAFAQEENLEDSSPEEIYRLYVEHLVQEALADAYEDSQLSS